MPSRLNKIFCGSRTPARTLGSCLVLLLIAFSGLSCGRAHGGKPANIVVGTYFERDPEPYEETGDGCKFLVIEIEVENVSDKPFYTRLGVTVNQDGDEYVHFVLNDAAGGVYAEYQTPTKSVPLPESVDPGETARGSLSFIVPEGWSALTLSARHRIVPEYGEEEVFFNQEITKSGLSTPSLYLTIGDVVGRF